jgi:hypothetical protein
MKSRTSQVMVARWGEDLYACRKAFSHYGRAQEAWHG